MSEPLLCQLEQQLTELCSKSKSRFALRDRSVSGKLTARNVRTLKDETKDFNIEFSKKDEVVYICLRQEKNSYLFIFTYSQRGELLRTFGRMASREVYEEFGWTEAAVLSSLLRAYINVFQ